MTSKGDLILVSRIARATPYSPEYLSLLVRKGRIKGEKVGRNWHVSQAALVSYLLERTQAPQIVLANQGGNSITPIADASHRCGAGNSQFSNKP